MGSAIHNEARAAAVEVVRTLASGGHTAYFAGGCVRDELLGLEPDDYDVATDATPDRLSALFRRTALVGASFGVVLVKLHGVTIEVATFRSDGTYTDNRRPDSVTFSDPKADAERRDFTVNAIFLDPLGAPGISPGGGAVAGSVIDFVGGQDDLKSRTLRAVGDPERRLAEDHLRALRAVRLAAKLGFTIDPRTADAIKQHARELSGVSRERIGDELRRIMAHPSRASAACLAQKLGLDGPMLSEASLDVQPTLLSQVGEQGAGPGFLGLCLSGWAIDRGFDPVTGNPADIVSRYRRALCLSNEECDALKSILAATAWTELHWGSAGMAARKRAAAGAGFAPALALIRVRNPELHRAVREEVERLAGDGVGIQPSPLVTGDSLVAAGMTPGPAFKRILDAVYDAQLEGKVRDPAEGLELVRRLGV